MTASYSEPDTRADADTGSGRGPATDAAPGPEPESIVDSEPAGEVNAGVQPDVDIQPVLGHTARPLTVSAGLSVLAGVLAMLAVANGSGQVIALLISLAGAAGIALGVEARHRSHRVLGVGLAIAGVLGVLAAIGWGITRTATVPQRTEVLPGLLGFPLLVTGLTAGVRGYERWFVSAGAGMILLTVIVSGLVQDAPVVAMLVATAAIYVAWDVGEQAINLGQQVGRQANTWQPELVHCGVAVLVGGVGVVLGMAFHTIGVSGLPLLGLTALLAAALVLAAALSA